jgi:TRAP transporter 4TM/12TM fusion protein
MEHTEVKEPEKKRGWFDWFILIGAGLFILYHLGYISDFIIFCTPFPIGPDLHRGLHLGGILFFAFLLNRARKGGKSKMPPIYDVVLALVGMGISVYYGFFFKEIFLRTGEGVFLYSILGWILALLIIECTRRVAGIFFAAVALFFLVYPTVSNHLPGLLYNPAKDFIQLGEFMFISSNGIFGVPVNISATIVVMFLTFATILLRIGAGEFFIDVSQALLGAYRGGPAKVAVVASCFFGSISGASVANVGATGTFTIPLMKKIGYEPHYAGAVESVASLGGIFTPPVMGTIIFLVCDFIEMPYYEVIKYAIIPSVLYYLAIFIMIDQEAVRLKMSGLAKETLPAFWATLKRGWWYAIPVAVLLYLLIAARWTPQKSALWAVLPLLLFWKLRWWHALLVSVVSFALLLYTPPSIGLWGIVVLLAGSMLWKNSKATLLKLAGFAEDALRLALMVAVSMAAASVVIGGVTLSGIGLNISRELVNIAGGSVLIMLLLMAATSFVMGMGGGITVSYIFLALMVLPAIEALGIEKLSGHLFVFYWANLALITPPVCLVAFMAAGIAEANPFKVGWQACRLGLLAYILPFAFVYKPALLALSSAGDVLITVGFTTIGTIGLAFAIGGYFQGKLNWPQRILCMAGAGLAMFAPQIMYMGGGAILLTLTLLWQLLRMRSKSQVT